MITLRAPSALHGDALTSELAAAGVGDAAVVLVGDELHIDAPDAQRATVERVVSAHVPPPPPPDPADEFAAAVKAATTLDALKAALLGTKGPGAEPRRPSA